MPNPSVAAHFPWRRPESAPTASTAGLNPKKGVYQLGGPILAIATQVNGSGSVMGEIPRTTGPPCRRAHQRAQLTWLPRARAHLALLAPPKPLDLAFPLCGANCLRDCPRVKASFGVDITQLFHVE